MNEQLFLPSKFVKKTEKDNFNGLHSTHKKLKKNLNNFSTWFIFSWRWEMFNELPYKKWDSYSEDNLLATKNSNELLPFYEFLPFSVLQRKMYEPFSIYFKRSHSPVSTLTFWGEGQNVENHFIESLKKNIESPKLHCLIRTSKV